MGRVKVMEGEDRMDFLQKQMGPKDFERKASEFGRHALRARQKCSFTIFPPKEWKMDDFGIFEHQKEILDV